MLVQRVEKSLVQAQASVGAIQEYQVDHKLSWSVLEAPYIGLS